MSPSSSGLQSQLAATQIGTAARHTAPQPKLLTASTRTDLLVQRLRLNVELPPPAVNCQPRRGVNSSVADTCTMSPPPAAILLAL